MSHNVDANDESEKDEEFEDVKRKSGGSASSHYYKKRFFDDVTFEHKCKLTGEVLRNYFFRNFCHHIFHTYVKDHPDIIKLCVRDSPKRVLHLLRIIIIWRDNPNTKKHFQSSDAVNKEIIRHIFSNYWYIIHPYSCLR